MNRTTTKRITASRTFLYSAFFTFGILLNGCSVYKMEVQQGNALSSDSVNLLKPGMSKAEVITLLGNPLLQDDFHQDRWDYVYYQKKTGKSPQRKNITLIFKNNQLVSARQ